MASHRLQTVLLSGAKAGAPHLHRRTTCTFASRSLSFPPPMLPAPTPLRRTELCEPASAQRSSRRSGRGVRKGVGAGPIHDLRLGFGVCAMPPASPRTTPVLGFGGGLGGIAWLLQDLAPRFGRRARWRPRPFRVWEKFEIWSDGVCGVSGSGHSVGFSREWTVSDGGPGLQPAVAGARLAPAPSHCQLVN